MDELIVQGKKLNQQFLESPEYLRYISARTRLKEQAEVYERLNDFRRRNFELQNSDTESNLFDELTGLSKEYADILNLEIVNEFLTAEQRVCRMLRSLYETMSDGIEFDFEYLER